MIVVMQAGASEQEINHVFERIKDFGFAVHPIYGTERVVIGALGDERQKTELIVALEAAAGVERVVPILKPYKLAGRELHRERSVIRIGEHSVGGDEFLVMAGPCSVESEAQILETARIVKQAGAQILRGGAFKPRSSPYSFQGLEEEGLKLLAAARDETGLRVITEIMSAQDIPLVDRYTDIFQVGARNMQNFSLLKELSKVDKPVMLKRGMMSTVKELLMSAEYLMGQANTDIILCERGIRTFEDQTRNTLDLSAVPLLHELSHLPVIVDPTHGTGVRSLITPMARAAVAAGADGLMVEVHPRPEEALSDGFQALEPTQFEHLMAEVKRYLPLEGKHL